MKKILTLLCLGLAINANAGFFSDNDKAYYLKHIDEAKEKIKECKLDLKAAIVAHDGDKFKELEKDEECKNANKAIREHEEMERAKQEAKDKKEYDKLYKQALEEFKKMSYDEFVKLEGKLSFSFGLGSKYNPKDARYDAYNAIKQEKLKEKINSLIKQYPNSKLLDYKNKICEDAMYGSPEYKKCKLVNKAFEEHTNSVVKEYSSSKDKLKEDFNTCHYKIAKLRKSSKYEEAQKLRKSYICYMALKAAHQQKIYGYSEPMK